MEMLTSKNPANNQITDYVTSSSLNEIKEKVSNAHSIKRTWKELGVKKRIEILRPLLAIFKNRQDDIAVLTSKEIGKPIAQCYEDLKADFEYFTDFLDNGANYLADIVTVKEKQAFHQVVFEPRGVVACIVPWNFPFTNFTWSVIPNLIAGNTVIFKHSEECPLLGKLFEEIMLSAQLLPVGVFSAIHGTGEVGQHLVEQDVDMIWFIGSSTVGKKLAEIAGKKQIKVIMELGGSNPAIVFPDVNLDHVVARISRERFTNCGQICDAIKRLIVHKSLITPLVEKLAQHAANLKIGDPSLENTELGPLVAMRQLELLEAQVRDAVNHGATVVVGGNRPENLVGAYYQPTILTNIKRNMRVWQEETFGPVLPVMPFETEEEAIMLANDTVYGLGAVIFAQDLELARRVATKIDAGTIDINDGSHWRPCNPFGGYKASGMGREHGIFGFQELCQVKVIAE